MDLENVIYIFAYDFANLVMKPEVQFYNIFMYLYNKNILEYPKIVPSAPKFMILDIEGRSIGQEKGNKRGKPCTATHELSAIGTMGIQNANLA